MSLLDSATAPSVHSARIGAFQQPFSYVERSQSRSLATVRFVEEPVPPVTAKLSKRFYDTFGEEIANELVEWFNQVDETYRSDLRELNELNFARFDAKLDQRLAQFDTTWERRMAEVDAKWERHVADLRIEIQKVRADVIKWMFMFWAPTALATVGTALGVVSLLLR